MIPKQDLVTIAKKEFATTLKMMRAFPEEQIDFTPHERSSNAQKLMSTFVFEMYLTAAYVFGQQLDREKFKNYKPETLASIISDFQKETADILEKMEKLPEDELAKTIEFGGAQFTADSFFLMMVHDQIHHRGQLSVYVRLAGGKVPSVYGPSADDESTNL